MKFYRKHGLGTPAVAGVVIIVAIVVGAGVYFATSGTATTMTVTSTATAAPTVMTSTLTTTATSVSTATSISTATSVSTAVSTATVSTVSTQYVTSTATSFGTAVSLVETGSSLLFPLFNIWVANYTQANPLVHISTGSTGSGTGISQAQSGAAQIGCSDAYMSTAQLAAGALLNIPLAISAQQVNYNIPSLNTDHLNMSGPMLSAIYNGTVKYWDDPMIKAANPGLASQLPHQAIVPIHRQDSSGDTFIFTSYLTASTPAWNKTVGFGTTVSWPAVPGALAATGNAGMVTAVQSTPYSIAYIGISYLSATQKAGEGYAYLQNRAGNYVDITQANIAAAAGQLVSQTPPNEIISLIYAPGANSYPIINYEYAMVNMHQPNAIFAGAIKNFLTWAITTGNAPAYLNQVGFVPLPAQVASLSQTQINSITSP